MSSPLTRGSTIEFYIVLLENEVPCERFDEISVLINIYFSGCELIFNAYSLAGEL